MYVFIIHGIEREFEPSGLRVNAISKIAKSDHQSMAGQHTIARVTTERTSKQFVDLKKMEVDGE